MSAIWPMSYPFTMILMQGGGGGAYGRVGVHEETGGTRSEAHEGVGDYEIGKEPYGVLRSYMLFHQLDFSCALSRFSHAPATYDMMSHITSRISSESSNSSYQR